MNHERVAGRRASAILAGFLNGQRTSRRGPVLLPANCCPVLPATILLAGWEYEFVDIDPTHLGPSASQILRRVRDGEVGGVLWVHAFGYVWEGFPDFSSELKRIAPEVLLVDDRCLARPSFEPRNPLADLELYSTGYSKFVDLGEGGWGFLREAGGFAPLGYGFNETSLGEVVAQFRRSADDTPFELPNRSWLDEGPPSWGWDEYVSSIASAIPEATSHREWIARIYRSTLPESIQLKPHCDDWRVNILVDDPQRLLDDLSSNGLFASRHYPSLVPAFGSAQVPVARSIAARIVNLFNDRRFTDEMARDACRIILSHLDRSPSNPVNP
jgi:hypothetical protein